MILPGHVGARLPAISRNIITRTLDSIAATPTVLDAIATTDRASLAPSPAAPLAFAGPLR
jgi:hypothetical protein